MQGDNTIDEMTLRNWQHDINTTPGKFLRKRLQRAIAALRVARAENDRLKVSIGAAESARAVLGRR